MNRNQKNYFINVISCFPGSILKKKMNPFKGLYEKLKFRFLIFYTFIEYIRKLAIWKN